MHDNTSVALLFHHQLIKFSDPHRSWKETIQLLIWRVEINTYNISYPQPHTFIVSLSNFQPPHRLSHFPPLSSRRYELYIHTRWISDDRGIFLLAFIMFLFTFVQFPLKNVFCVALIKYGTSYKFSMQFYPTCVNKANEIKKY